MRKYWKLLRIKISLVFFFPMALGFTVAVDAVPDMAWYRVVFAFLAFFSGSFFASTLNFYADAEPDRAFEGRFKDMDLSKQPFATGQMGKLETVLAFLLSGSVCLALSLLVGFRFAVFNLCFVLVVGVLYSHPWFHLKSVPLTDILCNVLGMGLTLIAGMSLAVDYLPPVLFLVWGALFVANAYIPTVVNDIPFDREAGYKTSGVVFGARGLLFSLPFLTVAMVPPAVLVACSGNAAWQFKLAVLVGTPAAGVGDALVFYFWRPPGLEMNPDLVLVPMYLFTAFFIVYGAVRMAGA